MPGLRVFEVGERYGALTVVVRRAEATPVTVRCDCGTEKQVRAGDLAHAVRSCGTCTRWASGPASTNWQGGKATHPLYDTWQAMVARCHRSTHHKYPSYGARGITVCDRWRDDFWSFVADMGDRPDGTSLDRVDNDGPYAPENCRWATATEQRLNQRRQQPEPARCSRDYAHPAHETDTGPCPGLPRPVVVNLADLAAEARAALRGAN